MSRFYGSMQGSRGEATRCGTTVSGVTAHVRGWLVGAIVTVETCGQCGEDRVSVGLTGGSSGGAPPVDGLRWSYCRGCGQEDS
jgi:hypothetical protein